MITDLGQMILYFCPDCSEVTVKKITAFDLPLNKEVELECVNDGCESTVLKVKAIKDKYRITIECPVCSQMHTFTITSKTMWTRDFYMLACPVTGFGIFFVGKDKERLLEEYNAQNDIAAGIIAQEDFEEDELDLLLEIFERLNELAKDKAIVCPCGSDDIMVKLDTSGIVLYCKDCEYEAMYEMTEEFLEELLLTEKFEI